MKLNTLFHCFWVITDEEPIHNSSLSRILPIPNPRVLFSQILLSMLNNVASFSFAFSFSYFLDLFSETLDTLMKYLCQIRPSFHVRFFVFATFLSLILSNQVLGPCDNAAVVISSHLLYDIASKIALWLFKRYNRCYFSKTIFKDKCGAQK